jgi:hypothetical protein
MTRTLVLGLALALAAQISLAQAAQQQDSGSPQKAQPPAETRFAPGTALRVELVKTIDAKKAKAGDPVVVKTADELLAGTQVVAPRGTKIFGHVVAATPHKGDTPSTLEIAFDKIALSPENEVPIKAVIQALCEPEVPSAADYASGNGPAGGNPGGSNPMGRSAGGYPPMSSPGSAAPVPGNVGNPGGAQGGGSVPSNKPLPLDAQGVIGMSGVTLSAGAQANSVLTSQKHNVKLESDTQMILRTQ